MIKLNKSSLMSEAYMFHHMQKNASSSIVKVSGIGMQRKTLVGNAVKVFKSDSHVFVGADPEVKAEVKPENSNVQYAPASEAKQIATKVKDNLGETAGKFVLGSMVLGPPVIGGLLWGGTGLMIGAMVASPFVLVFVWSVIL